PGSTAQVSSPGFLAACRRHSLPPFAAGKTIAVRCHVCHSLGLRRACVACPPFETHAELPMSPLLILTIGIVTVLGMIIVLRLNAFLALITAALVVSLLAPGSIGNKAFRVADAFGSTAGKIGVVIALAAIIGQCMMDSGAADRI